MLAAVYMLHTADFSHYYIGSTDNPKRRMKGHLYDLRRDKHHCQALQRSFNKYGEYAFVFEIAREFSTIEEAREFEHQLLQENHGKPGCLNSSSSGLVSVPCPEITAKRIALLRSPEYRARASEKAKAWRAANPEKAKEHDARSASTRANSPAWRTANIERVKALSQTPEAKERFRERIARYYANGGVNGFAKAVIRIAADGTETWFPSGTAAAAAVGAHINSISRVCLGKGKLAAGYRWRFA